MEVGTIGNIFFNAIVVRLISKVLFHGVGILLQRRLGDTVLAAVGAVL